MKASINWLKKYIDLEGLTPEEIADKTIRAYKHFRDDVLKLRSIKEYQPDHRMVNLEMAEEILKDPITAMTPEPVSLEDIMVMLYRIFVED